MKTGLKLSKDLKGPIDTASARQPVRAPKKEIGMILPVDSVDTPAKEPTIHTTIAPAKPRTNTSRLPSTLFPQKGYSWHLLIRDATSEADPSPHAMIITAAMTTVILLQAKAMRIAVLIM